MHQAAARTGARRTRHRGPAKTTPAHVFTAAAPNLHRPDARRTGTPPATTRISHYEQPGPAPAT